jgi:hypothetical protein
VDLSVISGLITLEPRRALAKMENEMDEMQRQTVRVLPSARCPQRPCFARATPMISNDDVRASGWLPSVR